MACSSGAGGSVVDQQLRKLFHNRGHEPAWPVTRRVIVQPPVFNHMSTTPVLLPFAATRSRSAITGGSTSDPARVPAPVAALLAKYRVTAKTPATGQLRATPKFFSSQLNYHVNTSGHATEAGGEAKKAKRISHRTAAIKDVAGAIQASLVALDREGVPGLILPSKFSGIQEQMVSLGKTRGMTVGMLMKLIDLEKNHFEGGATAIYAALGLSHSPASARFPSPSLRSAATRVLSPAAPAATPLKESDFLLRPSEATERASQQGGQSSPIQKETVTIHNAPPRSVSLASLTSTVSQRQAQVSVATTHQSVAVVSRRAGAPLPHQAPAVGPDATSRAADQATDIDRQEQAIHHFQSRYAVFSEGLALHALRILMLQVQGEPAYHHLLVPRAEGKTRESYDPRLTDAVNYIRARASNQLIEPHVLAVSAMTDRIGPPSLVLAASPRSMAVASASARARH